MVNFACTHTQGRERVLRCLAGGALLGLLPPELLQIRQLGPPVNCRGKSCVWSSLVWSGHRKTFLHVFRTNIMKIISAISETPSMSEEEVGNFLESKLNLQFGTIDEEGNPNIQPVWFDYDKEREKLMIITSKMAKKVRNLRSKPNVYFSIDDENYPYKGVKGKGIATIIEDPNKTVPEVEKLNMKYLGDFITLSLKLYWIVHGREVILSSKLTPNSFLLGILQKCNNPSQILQRKSIYISSYSISRFWLDDKYQLNIMT